MLSRATSKETTLRKYDAPFATTRRSRQRIFVTLEGELALTMNGA